LSLRKEIKDILYPDKLAIHLLYEHTPDDTIPEVNQLALKYDIEYQTVAILARFRKRINSLARKKGTKTDFIKELKQMLDEDEE